MSGSTAPLPRPPDDWLLRRGLGSWGIGLLLLTVVVMIWSGRRLEFGAAAQVVGEATAAGVGLRDSSQLGGGIGRFLSGMWPFAIAEITETARIVDFDPQDLPAFAHLEERVRLEQRLDPDTFAMVGVEVSSQVLVEPCGYLLRVLRLMVMTLEMAAWATLLAIVVGLPLGLLGASNLAFAGVLRWLARGASSSLRATPEIILAMVLVLGFGFGPVPGILALGLHSAGFLGKFFADDMENADRGPQEALRAAGGGRLAVFRLAILPQVLPQYAAYIQYILERNVRTATIIGIVGAGGIGVELKGRWDMFHYQHVATILLAIFLTVVLLEQVVGRLRRRLI